MIQREEEIIAYTWLKKAYCYLLLSTLSPYFLLGGHNKTNSVVLAGEGQDGKGTLPSE